MIRCKYCNKVVPNMLALINHNCIEKKISERFWKITINKKDFVEEKIKMEIKKHQLKKILKQKLK